MTEEIILKGPKVGIVVVSEPVLRMPEDYEFVELARQNCLSDSLGNANKNKFDEYKRSGWHPVTDEYDFFRFDEICLFNIMRKAKHDRTKGIAWRLYGQMSRMGMPVIKLGIFDDLKKLNER